MRILRCAFNDLKIVTLRFFLNVVRTSRWKMLFFIYVHQKTKRIKNVKELEN